MSQNEKPRIRVKAGSAERNVGMTPELGMGFGFDIYFAPFGRFDIYFAPFGRFVDTYNAQYEELKVCRQALAEAEAEVETLRLTEIPKGWIAISPSVYDELYAAKRGRDELKAHVKDLAEQLAGRIAECDMLHARVDTLEAKLTDARANHAYMFNLEHRLQAISELTNYDDK